MLVDMEESYTVVFSDNRDEPASEHVGVYKNGRPKASTTRRSKSLPWHRSHTCEGSHSQRCDAALQPAASCAALQDNPMEIPDMSTSALETAGEAVNHDQTRTTATLYESCAAHTAEVTSSIGIRIQFALLMLGLAVILFSMIAASRLSRGAMEASEDSPYQSMLKHSVNSIKQSSAQNQAIDVLTSTLELQQMRTKVDARIFSAKRGIAKDIISRMCTLEVELCNMLLATVDSRSGKFHKRSSSPLDQNKGSYYAVWMWTREADGEGELEVAYKAVSMNYELKDVVEYQVKVEEEPVLNCGSRTKRYLFSTETETLCQQVGNKRTEIPVPVFRHAVMTPDEIKLLDMMMDMHVAKKALEFGNRDEELAIGALESSNQKLN